MTRKQKQKQKPFNNGAVAAELPVLQDKLDDIRSSAYSVYNAAGDVRWKLRVIAEGATPPLVVADDSTADMTVGEARTRLRAEHEREMLEALDAHCIQFLMKAHELTNKLTVFPWDKLTKLSAPKEEK